MREHPVTKCSLGVIVMFNNFFYYAKIVIVRSLLQKKQEENYGNCNLINSYVSVVNRCVVILFLGQKPHFPSMS